MVDVLMDLADKLEKIAADEGLSYEPAHIPERRYNPETGEPYYPRSQPTRLTIYSVRAEIIYALIKDGKELATALRRKMDFAP